MRRGAGNITSQAATKRIETTPVAAAALYRRYGRLGCWLSTARRTASMRAALANEVGTPHSGRARQAACCRDRGTSTSFHTSEKRGRCAAADGADRRCSTSCSNIADVRQGSAGCRHGNSNHAIPCAAAQTNFTQLQWRWQLRPHTWSMRMARHRFGRTTMPTSLIVSRNSVSASHSRRHSSSRYSIRLANSGRPGSPLQ